MGLCLSSPPKPAVRVFTTEEREHLVQLGVIAGGPMIIIEAVKSGNIFAPEHMQKALRMQAEWEAGEAILTECLRRRGDLDGDGETSAA